MSYEHSGSETVKGFEDDEVFELNRQQSPRWSEDETEKLLEMYNRGRSYSEMALELNRTYGSVQHKLMYLGMPARKLNRLTEKETNEIVKLFSQGKSQQQIAKITGRTYDSVRSLLRKLGKCS